MTEQTSYAVILSINGQDTVLASWSDTTSNKDDVIAEARWCVKQIIYDIATGRTEATAYKIDEPYCQDHNKPLVLRLGKYGSFYSCPVRLADGTYCKYRPSKS
jgi:hypothetical protein